MPTPRRRSLSLRSLAVAAFLLPACLHAEVNLEALSKKMSQWPREVTLIQDVKLNLKQPDGSVKPGKIAKDTKMEVVSIQPSGIEVRLQQTTIVLPAAVTDLEDRVANGKAAAPTANTPSSPAPGTPSSGGKADPQAVRQRFSEAIKDQVLTLEELNTFTPAEIRTMPENVQKHVAEIRKKLEAEAAQPTSSRPKPVLQSREMTPFIKEVMENLEILEGTNIKPYTNTISFKDKDYYLLLIGNGADDSFKKIIPKIVDYYTRVNRVSKKYEVVYLSLDRTPQNREAFVKEVKMPWPLLKLETVRTSKSFGEYGQNGVPNLVVVDRQGKVVSQGYVGEGDQKSFQPQEALFDLASLLQIPPTVFK